MPFECQLSTWAWDWNSMNQLETLLDMFVEVSFVIYKLYLKAIRINITPGWLSLLLGGSMGISVLSGGIWIEDVTY